MLGIVVLHSIPALCQMQSARAESFLAQPQTADSQFAETQSERFWLAGRYDGNRIIVYFDAVKFNGTLSSTGHEITPPVAEGFFSPVRIPENYAVRFQKGPNAEHFAIGDKYDLLLDAGMVGTVTLTTLVGAETDEAVGNDSFIGALATLDKVDTSFMPLTKDHYVLRRHRQLTDNDKENHAPNPENVYAYLEDGPVQFDVQTQIVDLLTQRMKTLATDPQRHAAEHTSPIVEVQAFHLPDGSLRYYASAGWYSGNRDTDTTSYALGAWIAPLPTIHILALEPRTFGYSMDEPKLWNVIDLAGGKTGVIVAIARGESIETDLFEYHDGFDLKHMHLLQSIAAGE